MRSTSSMNNVVLVFHHYNVIINHNNLNANLYVTCDWMFKSIVGQMRVNLLYCSGE